MKTQLIFKYIGMGIIAMLLSMCDAGGSDTGGGDTGGTGGDTTIDISTYTFSYEATPQGTATTLLPTWNEDISNVTYAIDGWVDNTETNKATIDASTGEVTIATDTIAGSYTISATGSGSYSGTATAKVYVTIVPADKTALDTAINAGITAWGNEGDFNYIITSAVADMSDLFKDKTEFNGDISNWNTSKVTNMSAMFSGATMFNQPIKTQIDPAGDGNEVGKTDDDRWNTSEVTNMNGMFNGATVFEQTVALNTWSVGAVTTATDMFANSGMTSTDARPCWWNGTTVNYFECLTLIYNLLPQGTAATVSPTWEKKSDGNTVTVTATYARSHGTPAGTVTAPTIDTNTGEVTIDTGTTAGSYTITATGSGGYSGTATAKVYVTVAPTPAGADTTGLTALKTAKNEGVAIWGNEGDFNYIITSAVTDMSGLFAGKHYFNGNISKWDTSKVESMALMFGNMDFGFNQPIGDWNTSNVKKMDKMFEGSKKFNQNIDNWNVGAVNSDNDEDMFTDSGMIRVPCWYDSDAENGEGAIRVPRPDNCPVAD